MMPHTKRYAYFFVITVVLGLCCYGSAQSYRGSIHGKVVDPQGNVIVGAKLMVKSSATGLSRETVTGNDGGYVLAELPAGTYTIVASSTGLSPVAQNVIVNVGLETTADFDLTQVER